MTVPQPDRAIQHAYDLLQAQLAPDMRYHNLWHTREDVLPAAARLAAMHQIYGAELDLLLVAAAYHDIGFTVQYEDHEWAGVRIMARELPQFGFQAAEIARIEALIMATRLPQSPGDLLAAILADADLDVLGRPDFFVRSEVLRRETAVYRRQVTPTVWRAEQLQFLAAHRYFTPAAMATRHAGKQYHMQLIRQWIADGA